MKLHKLMNNAPGESGGLLRVAMLIQNYHPAIGGAEKQLKSLVPFLQKEDCQIHIFTRMRPGLLKTEIIDGAVVHRVRASGPKAVASLSYTFGALAQLRRLKPHIIHAHELLSPTTTAVAAKSLMGTPVVAKVLGGGRLGDLAKLQRKSIGGHRIRLYSRWVNTFITVSTEIGTELSTAGVPSEKQCFIPNGVDVDRFFPVEPYIKERKREELQLAGGPIAVYTGRFASEKRLDGLIDLWPTIRKKHPFASLYLIGSGDEEAKLVAAANKVSGVRLIGAVHDVVPYLQAADLFVLPSEREGLSNAMLEAMSCGLPVVATGVGGALDVIQDHENGFVVPVGNAEAMQQTISRLMSHQELRESAGMKARGTILHRYSLAQTANSLRRLYDSLLQHGDLTLSGPLEVSA